MERVGVTLATRPGAEERVGRILVEYFGELRPAGPRSPVATASTFLSPGRVVHIVDGERGSALMAPERFPVWQASWLTRQLADWCLPQPRAEEASLLGLLSAARLERRAHYRAPRWDHRAGVHARALLYPVRAGHGRELAGLLAAGVAPAAPQKLAAELLSSTVLARGDVVVRFWQATATAAEELDLISRVVPRSGLGARLNRLLAVPEDLTTESGFSSFFTRCAMRPVDSTGACTRVGS